jgi:N-acetylglucosamine kinase-like BadF-type ATPase
MAGLLTYESPNAVRDLVTTLWPATHVIVASDVVSALVGASGLDGGVVVAAGTGTTALGTDMQDIWIKVDGWGHLLGDDGSGAWIGRAGINAALRAADGRRGGSIVLHDAAMSRWGDPRTLIREMHTSSSAASLASFAPIVREAASQDVIAAQILHQAGRHLADAAIAALGEGVPARVSLVGGVTHLGATLTDVFADVVRGARPAAVVAIGGSSPLDGAVLLAENASIIAPHAPYIHSFHEPFAS